VVDSVSAALRSEIMSRIRSKNTQPEMIVRKMLHKAGFRYRLHSSNLPGKPDLVFASRRKVIFIHGCFWHLHEDCKLARLPKTRVDFWTSKLIANKERDRNAVEALSQKGWRVLTVWECELNDPHLLARIVKFLND